MIDVTAAILIQGGGRILIARKKPGTRNAGLWEFVGGKIEAGESPEECLRRELHEELGIDAVIGDFVMENIHHYPDLSIRLIAYMAWPLDEDEVALKDHDACQWVEKMQLGKYEFAPADEPIVKRMMEPDLALPEKPED